MAWRRCNIDGETRRFVALGSGGLTEAVTSSTRGAGGSGLLRENFEPAQAWLGIST